ncbi:hypothetical protein PG993_009475 [Apiospora rasikravindrae]|uniref:Uncharacterized protein n=1 Tax=Apiospora rasikravindrae TaxID=990691 RepID=A0ABR1SJH9_9PEZI
MRKTYRSKAPQVAHEAGDRVGGPDRGPAAAQLHVSRLVVLGDDVAARVRQDVVAARPPVLPALDEREEVVCGGGGAIIVAIGRAFYVCLGGGGSSRNRRGDWGGDPQDGVEEQDGW